MPNVLEERIRLRLRALVEKGGVSHEVLGKRLGLSRSATGRIVNSTAAITLKTLEAVCEFFQMTPAEFVAEPGSLIQPVTPMEAAFLAHLRQMTELERRSLLTLLERPVYTVSPTAKKSRLGRAMLTVKEQELVDLFARVKRDGVREGVLKTLRGAAHDDEVTAPPKNRTTG